MLYTDCGIKRRADRKGKPWYGTIKYKNDAGQWRNVTNTYKDAKSKSEAKQMHAAWVDEMEDKASRNIEYKTVRQAVTEYLNKQRILNQLAVTSYQDDVEKANYSIFPYIGDLSFYDLTVEQVQDWINKLAAKYKPSSVRNFFGVLAKAYNAAYKRGEIRTNVLLAVELPRKTRRKINYLEKAGRAQFRAAMTPESQFYIPSMIALYTGMRTGEICGLQWKDINYVLGTITVDRANKVIKDENGHRIVITEETKIYKKRVIPLMPQLKEVLQEYEEEKKPDASDFVVDCHNPHLLCTSFLKWAERNKIMGSQNKKITMHGLRHTFATVGVQNHMDIKSLSSILGHANTSMTLDTYASDDEDAKQYSMVKLANAFAEEEEEDF